MCDVETVAVWRENWRKEHEEVKRLKAELVIMQADRNALLAEIEELRALVMEYKKKQGWIDQVDRPDHPDDERPWCAAYLAMRAREEKQEYEIYQLRARIAKLEAAKHGKWCHECACFGAPNEPCKSCESHNEPSGFRREEEGNQ